MAAMSAGISASMDPSDSATLRLTGTLKLDQVAKKTGGDKYSCNNLTNGNETSGTIFLYLPQSVSRQSGDPHHLLIIQLSEIKFAPAESSLASLSISLVSAAKSSGGDKYEGVVNGEKFTPYLPQCFTRRSGNLDPIQKLFVIIRDSEEVITRTGSKKRTLGGCAEDASKGYEDECNEKKRKVESEKGLI